MNTASPHPPAAHRDHGRILVADDETVFLEQLVQLLHWQGYEAVAVGDAGKVREKLVEQEFDVLISDINMPGNARLELVRELAGLERSPAIILLTGAPTVKTAAEAVQLGALAYLLKPPEIPELLKLLERAVLFHRTRMLCFERRRHLTRWLDELEQVEQELRRPGSAAVAVPGDFVTSSMTNLMTSLVDFRRAFELVSAAHGREDAVWHANTIQALQKAVGVLERTRRNFKSTELRDLRHELEGLLEMGGGASGEAVAGRSVESSRPASSDLSS